MDVPWRTLGRGGSSLAHLLTPMFHTLTQPEHLMGPPIQWFSDWVGSEGSLACPGGAWGERLSPSPDPDFSHNSFAFSFLYFEMTKGLQF